MTKYSRMNQGRKILNIVLIAMVALLAGVAVWLALERKTAPSLKKAESTDSIERTMRPEITESDLIAHDSMSNQSSRISQGPRGNQNPQSSHPSKAPRSAALGRADIRSLTPGNPLYAEARKVLQGGLEEQDSVNRTTILNYCEHLRTAYTTKDIDFIRQVFSNDALIIVGNQVKSRSGGDAGGYSEKVRYSILSKSAYLERLERVFAANNKISVAFSQFSIMRHPTREGIYGVTLRQNYRSDRYADDGYLFLLWDFRNPSMPQIHVRTWQPQEYVATGNDIISLSDFNLE